MRDGDIMSDRTRRFAAAALAACVSLPLFAPVSAANADTCLTSAGPAGPKGSRWHYRIEWPSQRKCWHLVLKDARQKTAVKVAPQPQADADDETEPTPAPNTPAATNAAPARITQPQPASPAFAPAPAAPRVQTLITRNASNTDQTAQPAPWPDPSANAAPQEQTPATAEQPAPSTPAPASAAVAPAQAPQPSAATIPSNVSAPDSGMTWRLLFAAIALIAFAGAAMLVVMEVMRRRHDVLNTANAADAEPENWRDDEPLEDAPTFAPLPPMGMERRDDDVEQAVRRFVQNQRRRAAA
jgi:hypothetical protein